jgi:hypothetical protein
MIASFELSAAADLETLRAVIARSPIVLRSASLTGRVADWATIRQSPDVDAFILAWIASHVRDSKRLALLS